MKKLMTMLSAVALAFGVQAAGTWYSGTSFEGQEEGRLNPAGVLDLTWEIKETQTVDVVAIPEYSISGGRAAYFENSQTQATITRALSVKTVFGDPIYCSSTNTAASAKEMGTVFVDTLVKPTICEDDQITLGEDAKIAIWFKEVEDGSGNIVSTNLMVTAGYLVEGGSVVTTNYDCGATSGADDWQRFTVKSFKNITTSTSYDVPGFVVFRNGTAVRCSAAKGDQNSALASLGTEASIYNKYGELFPSADQSTANKTVISKLGFDGTGLVDDILFTDNEEAAPPFRTVEIAWDSNVTGFDYSYEYGPTREKVEGSVSGKTTSGSILVDVYDDDKITISHVAFKSGYIFDELTIAGNGIAVASDDSGFDITFDTLSGASGLIKSKQYSPNVNVTIGANATNFFTLADAFAYINTQSGAVAVQMNAASTAEGLVISPALVLNGANLESITIDLNGQALTYAGAGYAITAAVPLTITDTSTGGSITATEVVTNTTGQLTINAGTFIGKVAIGGTAAISGGTFNGAVVAESATGFITGGTFAANYKAAGYLATGYEATRDGGVYTVAIGQYKIEFWDPASESEEPFAVVNYTYNDDSIVLPEDPTRSGFEFKKWVTEPDGDTEFVYEKGMYDTKYAFAKWEEVSVVTYDITVMNGVNMTVAVITNGVAAGADGVYTVVSNDSAKVIFTAAENYNIDGARAKTNEYNNISANIAVEAPVATQDSQDPIPPLPAEPTAADVTNAIDSAKFADAAAVKAIIDGDPVKYAAFKAWADTVTGGEAAVVAGPHAAVSYQLSPIVASATLFANEPTLTFTEIKSNGANWDVTVELKDGDTAVQLAAAKEAFASRVWKGGSLTTMEQCTPSDVTDAAQEGGTKVKLTVTPPAGNAGFIKIKAE